MKHSIALLLLVFIALNLDELQCSQAKHQSSELPVRESSQDVGDLQQSRQVQEERSRNSDGRDVQEDSLIFYRGCLEAYENGLTENWVCIITVTDPEDGIPHIFTVYCDMETDGVDGQ